MIGTVASLALLCLASLFCITATTAFEFDLISRSRPLKFFAPDELAGGNEVALLNKAYVDGTSEEPSEDNAGFERPPVFGGRSQSSTRRLIQEPPLKRSRGPRLIKPPPLKRHVSPHDLVYRFPYTLKKASRFGPAIQPIEF